MKTERSLLSKIEVPPRGPIEDSGACTLSLLIAFPDSWQESSAVRFSQQNCYSFQKSRFHREAGSNNPDVVQFPSTSLAPGSLQESSEGRFTAAEQSPLSKCRAPSEDKNKSGPVLPLIIASWHLAGVI